jgi:hypothetical protein
MSGRHKHKRKRQTPAKRVVDVPKKTVGEEQPKQAINQEPQPKEPDMPKPHWTTGVGIFIAAIVAVIYFFQLVAMRDSVDLARTTAQIDQRPYLWTTNQRPKITIKAGEKMWANIQMVDYGKAPALRCRSTGKIFIGPTAKSEADQWFADQGARYITQPNQTEFPIPPGIPSLMELGRSKDISESTEPTGKFENKFSGGFGGGGYTTIMNDNILTQPDVDYILNTEQAAVMVLRMQYFDGFGNFYYSAPSV